MATISTHILTKRMTYAPEIVRTCPGYFNSHPHEEDDYHISIYLSATRYFNSHPHEEDDSNFKQK